MFNNTWQPILKSALAKLRKFARRADFDNSLKQVFGADIQTGELQQAWLKGNFPTLPNLEIIASSQINGALGAFAATNNTIYLSSELIKGRNLNAITDVFLEEYGHYLDSILNQQDTAGDEGEYFAAVVTGKTLSLSDITRLQTENDKVVVTLAGQAVEIEQNTMPIISVSVADGTVSETDPGSFALSRSLTDTALTVSYTLTGTAQNGSDYLTLSGTATFAVGSATATITVTPIDDAIYEFGETVTLTLNSGTSYTLGTNNTATLTIVDNDLVVKNIGNGSAPQVDGNKVVWSDGSSVYLYDGSTTTTVASGSTPQISGNNVVYQISDYDIGLYNGTQTSNLSNTASSSVSGSDRANYKFAGYDREGWNSDFTLYEFYDDYTYVDQQREYNPLTSGNNVVYSYYKLLDYSGVELNTSTRIDTRSDKLYLYNGTQTITLADNASISQDYSADIDGSNVVYRTRITASNSLYEIYLYNGSTSVQLTNNSYEDRTPQISGNKVAWAGFDGADYEIYFYDGATTIQLTNNNYDDSTPQISGNNVVWSGSDGTDTEIYFYNGSGIFQLTNNTFNDTTPQISGNNVVWSGSDGTDTEIYFYNGNTTITLTNNNVNDSNPQVSGKNVVWNDSANKVYFTTIETTTSILPNITVTATDDTATETAIGITSDPGVFTLTRTGNTVNPLTINYQLSGTAIQGTDYSSLNGTATFAPGSTTTTITVTPTDDFIFEGNETVNLTLATGTGYNIGTAQTATVTIADNDAIPQLSINDVIITEGNSGTKNANFILTLSNPSTQTISVNYQTVDDDATTANNDYVAKTGTITFTPGQTTQTLPITINGDTVGEINEAFTVLLTNAVNATLVKNEGIGIIRNDDLPSVTVTPIYNQATESGVPGIFQLNRTGSTTKSLNINYSLSGTATNGTDYAALNGTANFAIGSSTAIIFVTPTEDIIFEGNETATLTVLTGTGYTVGASNSSTIIIADNETQPTISINDVTVTEGNSGTKTANFAVTLSHPSTQTITVAYQTSNISATAGTDYIAQTGTITFNPGETSKTASIVVNGDIAVEANETFKVTLSTPVNATIADAEGIGTINNDDTAVTVIATDAAAGETLNGTTPNLGVFTLTRQGITNNILTVNLSITGTGINGTDYTSIPATATFAANSTTTTVTVTPTDDIIFEGNETATLTVLTGTGYTVGATNSSTITIADNETQPTISINDVTLTEGNSGTKTANFAVTLSHPSTQTITVAYQTSDISATAGTDYIAQTGTITFNPGETSKTASIVVNGDIAVEANDTFKVTLSTPVNATIADAEGIGTINNDDIPTLTVNNLTVVEGLDNNAIISFNLNAVSNQAVSVNYSTTAGTAAANTDYTATSGILTIPANTLTGTVSIPIINNTTSEANETFNLVLSNPVGVTITNTSAVITITDTLQSSTTVTLPAGVENLQLTGTTAINGTGNTGNNIITGNSANNILAGGDGADTYRYVVTSILGSDTIQESATGGIDTINFTGTTAATTLNLGLTTTQTVVTTNLSLTLSANNVIENLIGGNGADNFTGNILNNSLIGGLGADNLRGGDGADSLTGGAGNDNLAGNAGNDQFIYSSGKTFATTDFGLDTILDFTVGSDKIVLSKATFISLTSVVGNGFSQSANFAVVGDDSLVATQGAFIVYSSGSGNLFYNQNGVTDGLGTGAVFANLFNTPANLTGSDFVVVA
ncbi:hypothetical protein IQ227_03230 [Anabaena aphanizomenioides LEGE 00250]|uniref:Calx-beta domain-containing protein n=1 Tax=Sphaerospermopsis aphanizomenoides LEGE 00250 TaxID=2777972 RepID=A0ABR9V9B7_9CYAN|nr:Calx-beta domain-containing protein [Sphaerospermopsis aphanizomenoides]MBE9235079.1 hypothetical protein [Sphaerospermopsis aphanizomenoides LEGE 00250]